MKSKLKSDKELKKDANHFFDLARKSVVVDFERNISDLMQGGFRVLNGMMFSGSKQVLKAQHNLISRSTKLLGPKMGHEKEIEDIAWGCVCQSLDGGEKTSDLAQIAARFIDKLVEHIQTQFKYVMPNYAIYFVAGVTKMQIGPVEAMLTTELLSEIGNDSANKRWVAEAGSAFQLRMVDGVFHFELPPIVWRVSTRAARGHLEEEAIWLINIATSLLRLSYPTDKRYGLFPGIGENESLPIYLQPITKQGITFSEHGTWGGKTTMRKLYEIDENVISSVTKESFINKADAIFFATEKSLGARFGQGLGWLSRGRQTSDRAEKFLFFFTAIEALLSGDDKSAPIVQTVSRYVAVILQDEAKQRFELANKIKSLYALRSTLVHTGKRNVSNYDVSTIQLVAEALYYVVMDRMELKTSFEEFHSTLAEASYGIPWGKDSENNEPTKLENDMGSASPQRLGSASQ